MSPYHWAASAPGTPGLILVVDDEEETRDELREALETLGHEVVEAMNGREALELLTSERIPEPRVILLDLRMPIMTGWEFLAILRSYHRLSKIPVIVLSGVTSPDPKTQPPFVFRLAKPFDVDALLATVAQTFDARS